MLINIEFYSIYRTDILIIDTYFDVPIIVNVEACMVACQLKEIKTTMFSWKKVDKML